MWYSVAFKFRAESRLVADVFAVLSPITPAAM
jgi:hypothetical protein